MSRGFASNYRIVLVAIGICACFGTIGTRLVWLHVIDRDALRKLIERTRSDMIIETARRGDIYDAHDRLLATSRPFLRVAVDPAMVRMKDEAKWPELAELLHLPLARLRRIFTTKYRFVPAAAAPAAAAPVAAGLKLSVPGLEPVASPGRGAPAAAAPAAGVAADDDKEVDADPDPQGRRLIQWAKLSDNVTEATWHRIEQLHIAGLCPPERHYARVYPHDELAAHIIGFTNHAGHGVAGVESYADFYLRGRNGWREGEKDGRNHELAQFQTRNVPRADGYNVKLSIDATVQDIVERELDRIVTKFQPHRASIIVSNPKTGFILAMANYPTFDPNKYNLVPADDMVCMKNAAVADVYEPGSVFKIVVASGALQEGLVTPATIFNCAINKVEYLGRTLGLPHEAERFPHQDAMSVADIIAESSNRGAAQLGMLLGKDRLYAYARRFGFGHRLGFPVGGEVPGILAPPDKWYPIDITRIPMGQSIAATVLQMNQAMCVIANGGLLMRPQIITEITDSSNAVVYRYTPVVIDRVISPQTAATVTHLLQRVTEVGTAPDAAIKINGVDYEVAGKTGTAQKLMREPDGRGHMVLRYSHHHHVGSFIGFFPASNPQVAISVVVDDADGRLPGGWGAQVAAPSFRRIGEKLIPILSITPPNQPARIDIVAATQGGHR